MSSSSSSYCELCGRSLAGVEKKMVVVDGTVFKVCMACSRHGKPYTPSLSSSSSNPPLPFAKKNQKIGQKPAGSSRTTSRQAKIGMADELVLDPDFPRIIREARMKKGITHEQLGMQMNEKANLLRRYETGALKPDEIFAKKLERHLGIKLYVSAASSSSSSSSSLDQKK